MYNVLCCTNVYSDVPLIQSCLTFFVPPAHKCLAPPPRPEFSCSLADDGESVTFNWSNSYNSKYSVNHYCIESLPCSACNISPDTLYVCDGLQVGMEYVIILKAVNCDVQRGAAESINITLQGM